MPNRCTNDPSRLEAWITSVLDPDAYDSNLGSMLEAIPTFSSLGQVSPSSTILVRADIDVPIKGGVVQDVSRLDSFRNTIEFCRNRALKPILLGHVGRDPGNTAAPVATALAELYKTRVHFVDNWFDESTRTITPGCKDVVAISKPGELILLENTRKYPFERALWDADRESIRTQVHELDHISVAVCKALSQNYIFDALASSNSDWSSVVVPAYMKRAALSDSIKMEFERHVVHARRAQIVVFSGLKMDKLNDLECILAQGNVQLIILGGALAVALLKGRASLSNQTISIGLADSPHSKGEKYYIAPERVQQAQRILTLAAEYGVRIVLPIDFVLDDGTVAETIPPDRLQMDVGPRTISHFESVLRAFLDVRSGENVTIFYNGVLGKFEDKRFEVGTKQMMHMLNMLTRSGANTYVGGGEGLLALQKYGEISWVTHAFTSGGTILKALSGRVISYLSSLAHHARESG